MTAPAKPLDYEELDNHTWGVSDEADDALINAMHRECRALRTENARLTKERDEATAYFEVEVNNSALLAERWGAAHAEQREEIAALRKMLAPFLTAFDEEPKL